MSLIAECKPCPECECEPTYNRPHIDTEIYPVLYVGGSPLINDKVGIDLVTLTCQVCGYQVRAKSLREAVGKWNKLSDENDKKNHIYRKVCKHCGEDFDYVVETTKEVDPETLEEVTGYKFNITCCDSYESRLYDNEQRMNRALEKQYEEVVLQRGIDEIKEK